MLKGKWEGPLSDLTSAMLYYLPVYFNPQSASFFGATDILGSSVYHPRLWG